MHSSKWLSGGEKFWCEDPEGQQRLKRKLSCGVLDESLSDCGVSREKLPSYGELNPQLVLPTGYLIVEDEEIGQIPRAYVVRVASSKLSENQVIEFVAGHARPLLEEYTIEELIDPRLGNHYSKHEAPPFLPTAITEDVFDLELPDFP
ncbi:hypothetical protein JHK87_004196 [Glycine soja]|nr:hypothetical protein JHK87_004196 [Glycine soja]